MHQPKGLEDLKELLLRREALLRSEEPESALACFEQALKIAPSRGIAALEKWKTAAEQLAAGAATLLCHA